MEAAVPVRRWQRRQWQCVVHRGPGCGWEGATADLDIAVSPQASNVERLNLALASVDAGRLTLVADAPAVLRSGDDERQAAVESGAMGPGDGVLIEAGTSLTLRNDGPLPAEALLIVIARTSA